ncbi:hypothetical protein HanXRQr2_Chr03g0096031 [Helianthus annuus]|uniref:Uncharacterized protein n=1 Tax=Helianthus annuus TaxID=4232 RepID=A0A9K3JE46_HELAN|nr:hypothetical protein HanXRQr2_Chr03g0096031 [Helianthus annuus]KAJ0599436.1 hypothetical protein HanIR_Chr03g0104841 [Helianthus annuus]KAJ0607015.1 hypothetical protein HanHA89_Chr03g0091631 [Helianthus annuus]KAJ0772927.1 hypothetical protein HanOQP8_Chr03g0093021 [Helianthus annuus]KAJ0942500.1 hypothetical protein HanPSC8_Chr03g0092651 [Helianthus annuus]
MFTLGVITLGEKMLVAAGMSDRWKPESMDIPVCMVAAISKFARPHWLLICKSLFFIAIEDCRGVIGGRDVCAGEQHWYDRIKEKFMYPKAELFKVSDAGSRKGTLLARWSLLDDYIVMADSFEELELTGGNSRTVDVGVSNSAGSTTSEGHPSGATLLLLPLMQGKSL